ncbi:hypothetical protein [Leptospira bandrabouensis]|uniref:hypothetical protein n=1 Tax=Leptospira bandrabouensis TaxID=2484903 RepID=UPI001EEAB398|nr:hypothetical protein [Leptospira bandrabouensis]MCG6154120.1 hypothetical protein [Leptospira bandrabouensis]
MDYLEELEKTNPNLENHWLTLAERYSQHGKEFLKYFLSACSFGDPALLVLQPLFSVLIEPTIPDFEKSVAFSRIQLLHNSILELNNKVNETNEKLSDQKSKIDSTVKTINKKLEDVISEFGEDGYFTLKSAIKLLYDASSKTKSEISQILANYFIKPDFDINNFSRICSIIEGLGEIDRFRFFQMIEYFTTESVIYGTTSVMTGSITIDTLFNENRKRFNNFDDIQEFHAFCKRLENLGLVSITERRKVSQTTEYHDLEIKGTKIAKILHGYLK